MRPDFGAVTSDIGRLRKTFTYIYLLMSNYFDHLLLIGHQMRTDMEDFTMTREDKVPSFS